MCNVVIMTSLWCNAGSSKVASSSPSSQPMNMLSDDGDSSSYDVSPATAAGRRWSKMKVSLCLYHVVSCLQYYCIVLVNYCISPCDAAHKTTEIHNVYRSAYHWSCDLDHVIMYIAYKNMLISRNNLKVIWKGE